MSRGFQGRPAENPNNCTDPYAPSFWLGKPGALTQIRMPDGGIARDGVDNFAVHNLLDGQSVDRSPYLCRTWTFSHQWLTPDVMSVFMEYATRQRGIGPFILIDPQMKNLLTPNQASGTDALHSSEGFATVSTGDTLTSITGWAGQGERSLQWSWMPVTGASGVLRVPTQTGLYGFCLPPGATFAFSGLLQSLAAGEGVSVPVMPQVVLMNGQGSVQSTVRSGVITAATGTPQSFCVTGIVPTGSAGVYVEPQFAVTGTAVSGVLNANPYFETTVAPWAGANGAAVARDAGGTPLPEGAWSMLVVPDGVTSTPTALSEEIPVVAGHAYEYSAWLRVSSGGSASRDVGVNWYDASHVIIGSSVVTTLTPSPTVWTRYQPTQVIPPFGAAFARLVTKGPGVLTVANTWRVDAFMLKTSRSVSIAFDQLQFELTPTGTCTQWEYGQGQPLVGVRNEGERVPRILRTDMNYVAVEVT